jgi:hypothetical protein
MADKKKPKEAAPVFTKDELLDAAHVFGVSREVLAGALYGVEEATREEVEALVEEFKTKGV